MEYSPMMIFLLMALTPSDCASLRDAISEEAEVREVPGPSMTIENPHEYRIPGYFTFNDGKPFLVDKDPLTGALNLNIKTTPVVSSRFPMEPNDYTYDEEGNSYESDLIDRKDSNLGNNNNVIKDPSKAQADLHKFLNLPVHYSTSGKFPLISSSYANMKVQGHGSSSYSNHKPYSTTSSTSSPTYYDLKTATTTTTPATTTVKSTTTTTTTTVKPSTTKASPSYEYEYVEYDYDKYEPEDLKPSLPSSTTSKPTPITSSKPVQSTITSTSTTTPSPTTTTKNPTTQAPKANITFATNKVNVSIVTADKTGQDTTTTIMRLTTPRSPPKSNIENLPDDAYTSKETWDLADSNKKGSDVDYSDIKNATEFDSSRIKPAQKPSNLSEVLVPPPQQERPQTNYTISRPSGSVSFGTRNPSPVQDSQAGESYVNYHTSFDSNKRPPVYFQPKPFSAPENKNYSLLYSTTQRYDGTQNIRISAGESHNVNLRPPPIRYPGYSIPRPESQPVRPPQEFTLGQPVRPPQEFTLGQPPMKPNSQQQKPPQMLTVGSPPPQQKPAQESSPGQPPKIEVPLETKKDSKKPVPTGTVTDDILFNVQPERRPPSEEPPRFQHVQFHQPTKVESHFIRVPPGQISPSYSLQTSFSIGVPPAVEAGKDQPRPGQGVGQVLFPDDDPPLITGQSKPDSPKRPIWASERPPFTPFPYAGQRPQRPPQRPPTEQHSPQHSNEGSFPRPQWESHLKPPHFYSPSNALQKVDTHSPPPQAHNQPPKRIKPQAGLQRYDLPNILPQFRPNAKIGHGDYHAHFAGPINKLREPLDTLQPPPLPRPQHYRLNRNDESDKETFQERNSTAPSLVNRRTGPQANSRVTTLQMIQQNPPRRVTTRPDFKERVAGTDKEEPVFLVYPSNGITKNVIPKEDVVVVGTRGPQKPLSPDSLGLTQETFADDGKSFPIVSRDRADTPILKTKPSPKPVVKNDFPYTLIKPTEAPAEEIPKSSTEGKEYSAFSPADDFTSTEEIQDHDSEINLIPYLQDYMPIATKKPTKQVLRWNPEGSTSKPISVTLNTKIGTTGLDEGGKPALPSRDDPHLIVGTSGADFLSPNSLYTVNHRTPVESVPTGPQPQDFQAPFHASLSAPSEGWTVVSAQNTKEADNRDSDDSTAVPSEETKFDIENFKPQLIGGFKPIIPPIILDEKQKTEKPKER